MRTDSVGGVASRYFPVAPRYSFALSIMIVVALNLAAWAGVGLATALIF